MEIETSGEVKLNNNYRAYYARLFHVAHPEREGFFRNRERTSEKKSSHPDDKQVFIGQEAGEETEIKDRLRDLLNYKPSQNKETV